MFGNNAPDGAEILALLGMRPTTKRAPTLARPKIKFTKPRFVPTGSISAPDPSIRNSIQQTLAGVLSKAIDERQAHRLASRAMAPLTDATPLGNVTGAEEGGKQFYRGLTKGDLGTMALGAGSFLLSAAPLPGGVKRAGKRVGTGMFGSMLRDQSGAIRAWSLRPGYQALQVGPTQMDVALSPNGIAELSLIRTPPEARGAGHARRAMEELIAASDEQGITLALTPDPLDPATSKAKLEQFYRSLGFVPNSGRNKDFSTRAKMLRIPR